MIALRELDLVTYRSPLAFYFTDAVTGQAIGNGLQVDVRPFDETDLRKVHRPIRAEKSPHSYLYGFRSLPGLERYQLGDELPTESKSFVVQIRDRLDRFLPQTRRIALPLPSLQAQEITLYPGVNYPVPTGYGVIRGQLERTTVPAAGTNEVSMLGFASWARISLAGVDENIPSEEWPRFHTFADARARFLGLVPYPAISISTLLSAAEWPLILSIAHSPTVALADLTFLTALLPEFDPLQTPPFQDSLDGQPNAALFESVDVVDADSAVYSVTGPTNSTEISMTLRYEEPYLLRTRVENDPDQEHLSPFLVQS